MFVCSLMYLCIAKFVITHPCICDMVFGSVKCLNNRFENCVLSAFRFFLPIKKSPMHLFCASRMHVCLFAYAYLTVHLFVAKSTLAITHPCICDMLLDSMKCLNDLFGNCFLAAFIFFSTIQISPIHVFLSIAWSMFTAADVTGLTDELVDLDRDINHFSVLYLNLNSISHCSQYYDIDKFNSSFFFKILKWSFHHPS